MTAPENILPATNYDHHKPGPKKKRKELRHKITAYKHAPDVVAALKRIKKGLKSRLVDNAIRKALDLPQDWTWDPKGLSIEEIKKKSKYKP